MVPKSTAGHPGGRFLVPVRGFLKRRIFYTVESYAKGTKGAAHRPLRVGGGAGVPMRRAGPAGPEGVAREARAGPGPNILID